MNLFTVYWSAVYWAVMTMSTIGYGDVTPQTDSERIYVVIGSCPPPPSLVVNGRVHSVSLNSCCVIYCLAVRNVLWRIHLCRLGG